MTPLRHHPSAVLAALVLLVWAVVSCCGASYHLTWDANPPNDQVTNYTIHVRDYDSNNGWATNYSARTNTQMLLFLADAGTGTIPYPNYALPWSSTNCPLVLEFAATADNRAGRSDYSEPALAYNPPKPPGSLRVIRAGPVIGAMLWKSADPVGPWRPALIYPDYADADTNRQRFYKSVLNITYYE